MIPYDFPMISEALIVRDRASTIKELCGDPSRRTESSGVPKWVLNISNIFQELGPREIIGKS